MSLKSRWENNLSVIKNRKGPRVHELHQHKKIKILEEVSRPTGSDGVNPALLAYMTDCKMYD